MKKNIDLPKKVFILPSVTRNSDDSSSESDDSETNHQSNNNNNNNSSKVVIVEIAAGKTFALALAGTVHLSFNLYWDIL